MEAFEINNWIVLPVGWESIPATKSVFRCVFGVRIHSVLICNLRVSVSGISRYVLESAGKSCEKLAAADQKFIQGKSQNSKKCPNEKAGKWCQKKNEESRSDIISLKREECVDWRKQGIGATKCDRIKFDEGNKVELYEVSTHITSHH